MFSFFKKKSPPGGSDSPAEAAPPSEAQGQQAGTEAESDNDKPVVAAPAKSGFAATAMEWLNKPLFGTGKDKGKDKGAEPDALAPGFGLEQDTLLVPPPPPPPAAFPAEASVAPEPVVPPAAAPPAITELPQQLAPVVAAPAPVVEPVPALVSAPAAVPVLAPESVAPVSRPEPVAVPAAVVPVPPPVLASPVAEPAPAPAPVVEPAPAPVERKSWMERLRAGLRKTGSSISTVFTGTKIDEDLYEELETALLMADAGVKATTFVLDDLRRRVKDTKTTNPAEVKALLIDALTELLQPLEKGLVIGEHEPTVIMVAGVNGAGKTTSIGKLTRHLAEADASVLLAAADTFRAAAREQLGVWATRNTVEIIGQQGGDPAAVSFDAVSAGKARQKDVVLVDTAGRLPTQLHLMEELKKIKRVIGKAEATAPHEVLLVIDGNTGQNALNQVKAFDDALQLTGLIVTKLDGTAKGGVLAAIAQERPVPVYFIGVGEKLEDLQTFNAREFAQAIVP